MNTYAQQAPVQQVPNLESLRLIGVRLNYVQFTDKKMANNETDQSKAKYSATIMIPKTNMQALQDLNNFYQAFAASVGFPAPMPPNPVSVIKDGDAYQTQDGEMTAPCPGYYFIRTSSKFRPDLSFINGTLIADDKTNIDSGGVRAQMDALFYDGVDAHVILTAYKFDASAVQGRKGISFNLAGAMSLGTGEIIANGSVIDTSAAFGDLINPNAEMANFGIPAAVAPAPQAFGQAPVQQTFPAAPAPQAFGQAPVQQQPIEQAMQAIDPYAPVDVPWEAAATQNQAANLFPAAQQQQQQAFGQQPAAQHQDFTQAASNPFPAAQQQQAPAQAQEPAPVGQNTNPFAPGFTGGTQQ